MFDRAPVDRKKGNTSSGDDTREHELGRWKLQVIPMYHYYRSFSSYKSVFAGVKSIRRSAGCV